jgi:Na+-transporting methylmalonyl-CoA/oxaloacetate decarboxylase gamma subunit
MKKRIYEWEENKTSRVFGYLTVGLILLGLASTIVILFLSIFGVDAMYALGALISGFFVSVPFNIVASITSSSGKYTRSFLKKVRNMLDECKSEQELKDIYSYFISQAIDENNMFRLSYPADLREIHSEIIHKLDAFKMMNNIK